MARLIGLALSNRDGARVGVEVVDLETDELAIPRTRLQGGLDDGPECRLARVYEAPSFSNRQVLDPRRINSAKWLHLAPCRVRGELAVIERVVQRGLQDREYPVGA